MIQKQTDYEIETDHVDPESAAERAGQSVETRHEQRSTQSRLGNLLNRLMGSALTAIVLLGFAGLFYVGHTHNWRLPKFNTLLGTTGGETDDWCLDHGVPTTICVECNPDLLPRQQDHGWCNEHGVHNCLFEDPELAQLKKPPSKDELADDRARSEIALAVSSRKENNSLCTLYRKRIQFASTESIQQAGVDIGLVQRGRIVESVTGNGEIVYDPTRRAKLSARAPGSVWSVEKNVGDRVRKGELVALVDATEVGTQKSELLRAIAEEELQQLNVSRLRAAKDAVAGSRLLEAEAALAKARADVLHTEQAIRNLGLPVDADQLKGLSESAALDALRLLGIPQNARDRLDQQSTTANLLPIVAPMDGVVIKRSVSLGEVIDASQPFFEVADTTQMWLKLSVPLEKVEQLSIGQRIVFRPDGSSREVEGRLDWVSTGADAHTRMVTVRAVLDNRDGRLRDSTFGTGRIILRDVANAITIPAEASHWEGCCQIAFVRHKNYFSESDFTKLFHVRSIRLGATFQGRTEVIAGLLPGEVVAVEGSDVLRAQLLKNGLGAGCCVEE